MTRSLGGFCICMDGGNETEAPNLESRKEIEEDLCEDFETLQVQDKSNEKIRNSMLEIKEHWKMTGVFLFDTYKQFYDSNLRSKNIDLRKLQKLCEESSEKFSVFAYTKSQSHLFSLLVAPVKPNSESYEVLFDGERFIYWKELQTLNTFSFFYVTGKSLELFQHARLYQSVVNVSIELANLSDCKFIFVQGVPGCGKTHCIIENIPKNANYVYTQYVDYSLVYVRPVLILTPTRESANEIRERLVKRDYSEMDVIKFVMTIDSYFINRVKRRNTQFDVLIIEEGLMLHAGQIAYAIHLSGAKSVLMIGDSHQIPFINRIPQNELKYIHPLEVFTWGRKLSLNTSFRCTLSVAVTLSPLYSSGMTTINKTLNNCILEKFTELSEVRKNKGEVYLTFKQSEKKDLLKAGFECVHSIHEFQSKQADDIVVIRFSGNEENTSIYNSRSHALVAFSRHCRSLRYVTPDFDDELSTFIKTSKSVTCDASERYLKNKNSVPPPIISDLIPNDVDTSKRNLIVSSYVHSQVRSKMTVINDNLFDCSDKILITFEDGKKIQNINLVFCTKGDLVCSQTQLMQIKNSSSSFNDFLQRLGFAGYEAIVDSIDI